MKVCADYLFRTAELSEVESVFRLYENRIHWMNQQGIRQWNMTGYLEAYPIDYYIKQQNLGNLYVLTESNGIVGAVVLLQEDSRWPDSEALPALYIHNLVTDSGIKGAGKRILRESEKMAFSEGKRAIRLDCAVDNAFLNNYYEFLEYKIVGACQEGTYIGNRREKILV